MSEQLPPPIPGQKISTESMAKTPVPYYKKKWLIPFVVIVGIVTFNSCGSDAEAPTAESSASPEISQPAPSPTPSPTQSAVEDAPSPSPSEDEPESPIIFAAGVNDALGDMEKDLSDLLKAVDDGGVLRVALNVAEVVANLGQMSAHTPPLEIADEWNVEMLVLETEIYALGELVNEDGTVKELKSQVRVISKQIDTMRDIVAKLG